MQRSFSHVRACLALSAIFSCFSCAAHAQEPSGAPIEIRFAAEVAGAPFSCEALYSNIGATKAKVRFGDFRAYVSKVELIDKAGARIPLALEQDGKWQYRDVALLDFENGKGACANGTPQTNTSIRGRAPKGEYRGLSFEIGIPFDLNHTDVGAAPAPLNLTAMAWAWQVGRRFLRVEIENPDIPPPPPRDPNAPKPAADAPVDKTPKPTRGWSIHLGSTQCASENATQPPTKCDNPNRIAIGFEPFDVAKNRIVLDLAPALAESDVTTNTPKTSVGCMAFPGDPECAALMPLLGLPYGGKPARPQQFVRIK